MNSAAGLQLFIYTPRCVYDDCWDEFTVMARGLILDEVAGQVIATPFPKLFNVGERRGDVPDLPFEAFEKLDGSLEQALWAQTRFDAADQSPLTPGTT